MDHESGALIIIIIIILNPFTARVVSGQVPTLCLDSGIVSQLRLHWVKSVCVFRCNLPPALLAE